MGGSGGGGGPYYDVRLEELSRKVEQSSEEIRKGFLPDLDDILGRRLDTFSQRNVDRMNELRDEITSALEGVLETSWDLPYGGSVAKRTDVNGLSDIDIMLVMKDGNLADLSPSKVREKVANQLKTELDDVEVSIGNLAVTVKFPDEVDVQLIPAVRDEKGYKIPSWSGDSWSKINPQTFRDALTRRNKRCGNKLIPTITLAKAIIAKWPASVQLSGYHVESLAIDAFRGYSDAKTLGKMLPHFFEKSAEAVLSPIRDKTGQSVKVDTYLGNSRSPDRLKASHWFSQTAKRMRQASLQGSRRQWEELFE